MKLYIKRDSENNASAGDLYFDKKKEAIWNLKIPGKNQISINRENYIRNKECIDDMNSCVFE